MRAVLFKWIFVQIGVVRRKENMKNRGGNGFSILELMVGVMILSVLVAAGMTVYGRYRDRTAMLIDQTNQKVLLAAAKLFAYDNNALPGSLSELRPQDLERAYAMVTKGKRPYTLLAYLQEFVGMTDLAEAADVSLPDRYLSGNPQKIRTCPMDRTPPPGGVSYGIDPGAAGRPLSWLLDQANADAPIVVETDVADGSVRAFRHQSNNTCIAISASGVIQEFHYR